VTPQDLFALNDPDRMTVDRRQIAGRWVAVVDGVYRDPDAVRQFALCQHYGPGGGIYPGRFAIVPLSPDALLDLANRTIPSARGSPLISISDYEGSIAFAVPIIRGSALSASQAIPHSDGFCDYAAVLYLSRPEDCIGGTSFWRHRRSGLEYAPAEGDPRTRDAMERHQVATPLQLSREMMREALADPPGGYMTESNGIWERLDIVEMRQNRLLIYDANLFHSMYLVRSDWTPDLDHPRLTQNLYLCWADTPLGLAASPAS